jgi:MoaA/NifB/PqqE/SkfB family radical SAM enzyme
VFYLLKRLGVEKIGISGGEPLLKEGLVDLLQLAREDAFLKSLKIALITNGTLLNEKVIDVLRANHIALGISLPGISTYSFHTESRANTVQEVLLWIKKASENGILTTVGITVTRVNIEELFETMSIALKNGANSITLSKFIAGGRGGNYCNELSLSQDECLKMLDIAEFVLKAANKRATLVPRLQVSDDFSARYKHIWIQGECSAAKQTFTIDPSGYIRVCNLSTHRCGHILDSDIILDKEYWNGFTNGCNKLDICGGV